jgi:hypothetical protein
MQPLQITSETKFGSAALFAGVRVTVHAGCPVCQGPLVLAAYIAPALGNSVQRIYCCAACDRLEWVDGGRV